MGIAVDDFLDRMPNKHYKCFDFVREVWRSSFGVDVGDKLKLLVSSERKLSAKELRGVTKLSGPIDPCFVVMQRPRSVPHIGIFHDGRILHLSGYGAAFDFPRFVTRRYKKVTYWQ